MSFANVYSNAFDYLTGRSNPYLEVGKYFTGRRSMENTQASLNAQIAYDSYLASENRNALRDWYANVGKPQGRTIKYPAFSYAGQINRANTSIARAGFDYDTAYTNYVGNLPYRTAGLYGIAGKLSRSL